MPIDSDKMTRILHNFVSKVSDVEGAAVVTPDGLPLASSLPGGIDDIRVSAMSATMLSLGEKVGAELAKGGMDQISVTSGEGFSILTNCGKDAVLIVLAGKEAKQGVLQLEIQRVVDDLKVAMR